MDAELQQKYKDTHLTPELVEMFADIISKDKAAFRVFIQIGKQTTDEYELGITIGQLVEQVKLRRRVQRKNTFVVENANIDRKHAERVVSSLKMMGLCYYRSIGPSQVINYTIRGKQVSKALKQRLDKAKGVGNVVQ